MITAGIDLASQAYRTAACVINWDGGSAAVLRLVTHLDDAQMVDIIESAHKVGIDVPFGWPDKFVEAVSWHAKDGSWPNSYDHAHMEEYRFRATDRWLRDELKCPPLLSVSTDLISIPAMRAAAVLSRLPEKVALDGSGVVVEVYPALALRRWGFPSRGYKGKRGAELRTAMINRLVELSSPWLHLQMDHQELCIQSDDAFDAVISALVARASAEGLVERIPRPHAEEARREGWIAVPDSDALQRLA
jgi:predicted nuclease with RNAse H fold